MSRVPGRPVGDRILDVLQITETLGAATAQQIRARMQNPPVADSNVAKYCSRAVGLRLMTVDRSVRPMLFRVVPGWRSVIKERTRRAPCEAALHLEGIVPAAMRSQPNSVFALGVMA